MFSINLQRPLVTLAVIAGLLAVAGPVSAASTDLNGDGDRIHANPSAVVPIIPDGELSHVTGGIVTDNKDPDKVWTDPTTNATGAVVAADFNYNERARGLTVPLGSTKGSFMGGSSELLMGACRDHTDDPLTVNNQRVVPESDSVRQPRSCKWEISELDA